MRVWLDDVRKKPSDFDIHIYDAEYAIKVLRKGIVTHMSFDHDLGDESEMTGYAVARAIEEMAYHKQIPRLTWAIHSANPVGRENIRRAMEAADKYWSQHESFSQ